jgi:hypothetical protein
MRTRLRGLEIAGIQMGIEVPDHYDWEWPDDPVADFVCLPREPEVHIGLRVSEFSSADLGGECYGLGAWTFEVAARGDDWLVGLSRRGVREQLATFDRGFRSGEVMVSSEAARSRRFPLRTPLDEWIVLHRTIARGGLCLKGSAQRSGTQARIRLGTDAGARSSAQHWTTHRMTLFGRETELVREEDGILRSFYTPWSEPCDPPRSASTPVAELSVIETSPKPFRECLDPMDAAELLVRHAVVPLCDEALLDRVMHNARSMAQRTKVVRLGEVSMSPAPSAWGSAELQNAFGLPNSGV